MLDGCGKCSTRLELREETDYPFDGKVRLAIVFNVDFDYYGSDPQAGYAIIRKGGSCPACEALGTVMGVH